jgi:hypothetical protein
LKPSRRPDEPPFRTTGSKRIDDLQPEEMLIADKRAGLSPADMVERRFQTLLSGSEPREGLPRPSFPAPTGRLVIRSKNPITSEHPTACRGGGERAWVTECA